MLRAGPVVEDEEQPARRKLVRVEDERSRQVPRRRRTHDLAARLPPLRRALGLPPPNVHATSGSSSRSGGSCSLNAAAGNGGDDEGPRGERRVALEALGEERPRVDPEASRVQARLLAEKAERDRQEREEEDDADHENDADLDEGEAAARHGGDTPRNTKPSSTSRFFAAGPYPISSVTR